MPAPDGDEIARDRRRDATERPGQRLRDLTVASRAPTAAITSPVASPRTDPAATAVSDPAMTASEAAARSSPIAEAPGYGVPVEGEDSG